MSQHISRTISKGQICLLNPTLLRATYALPPYRISFPLQPSRCLNTSAAKTPRSYTPISRAPTPPPAKTAEELASGPYIVRRTPSIQLPVYKRFMSGGNRVVVLVKKVDGDRRKLLEDMSESLGVGKENIRINPTTQHVELKGDYYEETKSWLIERGF
ncbi:hypothetical protein QQS21_006861 [Conoideocrella luteorostrata]|uniref:Large ribosomal subunit protein mL49 n=1 Tax=Conoideocrella luteorostrata TaxID=1105319 RepID=A0AAJ0CLW7_9HYPO|nr:hypothetical protein QQS21_006861 [Conoideocrella luteorostrata]